jgi:hypothetical protein
MDAKGDCEGKAAEGWAMGEDDGGNEYDQSTLYTCMKIK